MLNFFDKLEKAVEGIQRSVIIRGNVIEENCTLDSSYKMAQQIILTYSD